MTEEQIFKAHFPEYCVGEKCLSPYFDLFQAGFEEGENQGKELQALHKEIVPPKEIEQMSERINEIACNHCNEVMCSVCENRTCDNTKLATLKCREWRDRRAGFYCGYSQAYTYAKTIIQDLLSNSDEYARQRAMDWLKEE